MHVLTDQELRDWLAHHPDWSQEGNEITTSLIFKNFVEAFGFMSQLAIEMERVNHHATITNTYKNVKISMTTHEADNQITDRDTHLAEIIINLKG